MQVTRNIARKFGASLALFSVSVGSAFAAIDPAITTAIDTAKTDVGTIGAAVLLVMLAIAVYKWLRRAF